LLPQIATGRISKIRVIFLERARYPEAGEHAIIDDVLTSDVVKERMQEETMEQSKGRWRFALIWMIAGIAILIQTPVFGQGEEPALVIQSPGFDAGAVWEGETLSHAFEVKNEGKAELKILEVKPG
jgi:hypothetical protein